MERFEIEIDGDNVHIANVLSSAIGRTFGSLHGGVNCWREVLDALSRDRQSLFDAATALTVAATPVEGNIHERRALAWLDNVNAVGFETPGGVNVRISRTPEGVSMSMDFGRDSKVAATEVAARLWLATASQQAGKLLAECSAELAGEQ